MVSCFSFIFCLFSFVIFVLFFHFVLVFILLSFCSFSCFNFSYRFFSVNFSFISLRFFEQNQMKTTWPRPDIVPKINYDGRGLIYACAAALC